jgi:hypothetical protein
MRWAMPTVALTAAVAIGSAAGVAIGLAAADPTSSEEYQAVERRAETAEARNDSLASEVAVAEDNARGAAEPAEAEIAEQEAALAQREADVTAREDAVAATEQRIADTSITQGIWTVGVDIEPGTYRTAEPVIGDCYWGVYTSGTNGSDIVDNDIPSGGFPTVTLSVGQDFENNGCGTFVKQ